MKKVTEEQILECRELLAFLQQQKNNKPLKHTKMKTYQITGYQAVYEDGRRDQVKLLQPETTTDIEAYRAYLLQDHHCKSINLSYITINTAEDDQ